MQCAMPVWLNVDFMEKVLRKSEKDASIEVKDVATAAATAVGDNYTSDMIRATVEYSRNKSGRKATEKISLIVKISPTSEGSRKLMVRMRLHPFIGITITLRSHDTHFILE